MNEIKSAGERRRSLPRWVGRVTFGATTAGLAPVEVAVDATTVHVATYRAVLRAKVKIARGQ